MILVTILLIPSFFLALIAGLVIIASMGTFPPGRDNRIDQSLTKTDEFFPPRQALPPS